MNIFEIFVDGYGRISEENMSSVLKFLLDPNSPHGFKNEPLIEFLKPMTNELSIALQENRDKPLDINRFVKNLTGIDFELEKELVEKTSDGTPKTRRLDLLIRFFDSEENQTPILAIAIENKIYDASQSDEKQLTDEYNFLTEDSESDYANVPILFIYLTPNDLESSSTKVQKAWESLELQDQRTKDVKCHYSWSPINNQSNKSTSGSISEIAKELLRRESIGDVNPPSIYTILFLKSLIRFIENDFGVEEFESTRELTKQGVDIGEETFWQKWQSKFPKTQTLGKKLNQITISELNIKYGANPELKFLASRISYNFARDRPVALLLTHSNNQCACLEVRLPENQNIPQWVDLIGLIKEKGIKFTITKKDILIYFTTALNDDLINRIASAAMMLSA